jgi:two-component system, OmpR family, phosphate regulon sensor histidine kinase PhoR
LQNSYYKKFQRQAVLCARIVLKQREDASQLAMVAYEVLGRAGRLRAAFRASLCHTTHLRESTTSMTWALVVLICVLFGAVALIAWRKWIAPWRQVEELVTQISRGEQPRTFLLHGAAEVERIGLHLEKLFQDLKQLRKQIAKRESGMQTIFSAMHDALLVVDSNRYVILANETFRKLFAVPEISEGTPLLEIVRDATLDQVIDDAFDRGGPVRCELALDSSQIELDAVATRNDAGEITGALVLFHDITELKKMDQVRRDFVANVSHELRTPLSILRGYIETLLDSPETSRQELSRILGVMERHSKRLDSLAEDLLTLAQLESANPNLQLGNVDLSSFFGEVIRDWEKKLVNKQLNVIVDVPPDFPTIRADRVRLREALYNLLDNAVKYSREHGEIRLVARRHDEEIVLSVSDDGIGISKEDLPRVFERFYRVDKARSRDTIHGTGLGLAIVKHIAQLHGGRVEAESEVGKGTAIRVVLPIVTQT